MKTEKIFAAFILIGLVFKILNWAGNDVILVVMLSTLAFIYMPLAFYLFSYKGLNNQKWGLSIPAGLAFSSALIGILFKLLYWKGAGFMIMIGLMGSSLMLIITFILSKYSSGEPSKEIFIDKSLEANTAGNSISSSYMKGYYRNMKIRGIVITFFAFLLWITPTSTLMTIQHHNDPEMARLRIRIMKNPQNEEYMREYREYARKK